MRTYFFVLAEALVSLLLCLVKKCPTVCNTNHFVVLLGAYGVTLSSTGKLCLVLFFCCCFFLKLVFICFSPTETPPLSVVDQKLLMLLREYEKNNVSLLKFQ